MGERDIWWGLKVGRPFRADKTAWKGRPTQVTFMDRPVLRGNRNARAAALPPGEALRESEQEVEP